jgi:class 3 adenylate cyclase
MRVHQPAPNHGVMDPGLATYAIRIKGQLGDAALSAFPALRSRHDGAETVLVGDLDQAALYGVVSEIEALGLDLIEIRQLAADRNTAESEDGR